MGRFECSVIDRRWYKFERHGLTIAFKLVVSRFVVNVVVDKQHKDYKLRTLSALCGQTWVTNFVSGVKSKPPWTVKDCAQNRPPFAIGMAKPLTTKGMKNKKQASDVI